MVYDVHEGYHGRQDPPKLWRGRGWAMIFGMSGLTRMSLAELAALAVHTGLGRVPLQVVIEQRDALDAILPFADIPKPAKAKKKTS